MEIFYDPLYWPPGRNCRSESFAQGSGADCPVRDRLWPPAGGQNNPAPALGAANQTTLFLLGGAAGNSGSHPPEPGESFMGLGLSGGRKE